MGQEFDEVGKSPNPAKHKLLFIQTWSRCYLLYLLVLYLRKTPSPVDAPANIVFTMYLSISAAMLQASASI